MTRTITKPGLYDDLTDTDYHADPVPGGSLSSTGARRLLDTPARYRWELENREGNRAFDIGHAVHAKVLGVGARIVSYPDEHLTPSGAPSTKKETREWEEAQRAAGLTIVSRFDMEKVDAMVEAVLAHQGARRLLEPAGTAELSAFARCPDTGVWLRARFDRLLDDGPAVDLKTTRGSASSTGFGAEAAKHGYPVQEGHYVDTLELVTGERRPMSFIVVEKRPPHLVAVHAFDEATRIAGRELAARARELYAACRASDDWPGYGDDTLTTVMPAWWWHHVDDDDEMEVI